MYVQMNIATRRLFGPNGMDVANIAVTPGSDRDVTADHLAGEINRALARIETGDFDLVAQFQD